MAASTPSSRAYFEQQREALIGEIAMSFEQVLANINKLNRNLEAVITVGNEFSSVEALWSTFENVMAKEEGEGEEVEEAAEGKSDEAGGGSSGDEQGQDEMKGEDEEQDRTVT
ncbi:dash complex subunit dad1 [Diaporthe amygdali]|uniref:dash complex subunit dad1 n=1 Tax=Phomopsis amygdali TaxID=1214568 RepID=UPI0022FEB41E|nr:dash complex subunit dad1 [Diaporthe amygdali]KAJ0107304.1 dash complex subunit dad1 [Diaporthe amygdali]